MTDLAAWVAGRAPRAPRSLEADLLRGEVGDAGVDDLLMRARARLDAALGRPGRDRGAAFDLLAADAWVTYACEAALDAEDSEAALRRTLAECLGP